MMTWEVPFADDCQKEIVKSKCDHDAKKNLK